MKKRFKKTAFFMALIGFLVLAASTWGAYNHYQIITTGEEISGKVTKIIRVEDDDGGVTYKPEVTYLQDGVKNIYAPTWSSSSNRYVIGDPVTLIKSDQGTILKGAWGSLLGIIIGAIIGLGFFIGGWVWFRKHRKDFDEVARLKRYGNVVRANFFKKETSTYTVNNQQGEILFFQEINGNRIFHTKPIFSEFSVKWLEEHPFDVYVDPRDDAKYFVDVEKLYGHAVSS